MRMLTLILVVCGLLASTTPSFAQDISCTGTVGGGATATAINGNVTVPPGASCTLEFVNVAGSVQVQPGGSLLVSAYDEPSTIGGNVVANRCVSALLAGQCDRRGKCTS